MTKKLTVRVMALAALLALPMATGSARADMIAITNANFADPSLGTGQYTSGNDVPGWSSYGSGVFNGIENFQGDTSSYSSGTVVPNGPNAGYLNVGNTGLGQDLSATVEAGTYTLTAYIGWRLNITDAPAFEEELWSGYGGQTYSIVTNAPLVQGQFTEVSTSFTVAAGDPIIGQSLAVYFGNDSTDNSHQLDVADVSLNFTASVPEPSSIVLVGLAGAIGSAYAVRRRKRAVLA